MPSFFERLRGTRLTKSDGVYLLAKITFVVSLSFVIGFLLSLLTFIVINYLTNVIVCYVYGLDPLNSTDKNVFYD
jgi:hypothetical protein